jgi:hypothetical protein
MTTKSAILVEGDFFRRNKGLREKLGAGDCRGLIFFWVLCLAFVDIVDPVDLVDAGSLVGVGDLGEGGGNCRVDWSHETGGEYPFILLFFMEWAFGFWGLDHRSVT